MSASKASGFVFWDSFEEDETSPDLRDMTSWDIIGHAKKRTLCSSEARSKGPTISARRFL